MLDFFRKIIPDTHPIRLFYHKVMAVIAALVYRYPANDLVVVGITGTNGKTTTVNYTANILTAAGYKVGMTSTINFQIGSRKWENNMKQTTLGPFKLQKLLRQMVTEGCKYAVLELSSHSATQSRIHGINIDVAAFTNITSDHIEYHGSFNSYISAKAEIFKKVSKGNRKFGVDRALVLNRDDKYFDFFNQHVADRKINYGMKGNASVTAKDLVRRPDGSHFVLHVPNNSIAVDLKMPGDFNVYNALTAASCALALNIDLESIKKGLEESTGVAGRFETVKKGQKYDIIVDYAHATDALQSLLELYKGLVSGKIFLVFGATGGGRDKAKRPKMGAIADKFADYIVVTNDDPYEEDEWQIIDQVSEGINRAQGAGFWKIPDRREAIRLALTLAREGDCVIVAGKGAEKVMMLRGKRVDWNDKQVIEEFLTRKIEVEIGYEHFEGRENVCLKS
ncbi:UDP-N-acetylmuramoyl-L-alanyl-D-glutamate--2,6-diaminopimelate ligase [Patescibacteria group bacterium]|nr:UDP-N-acetylmuramoyl-L-alanyl-D-glutamate--2,6-diaminopimelate ligase [Patescibacteria group bacterium]